ncbi:MAG TPA: arginase family protein [Nitrososphaerales archaeon]|nr:arginase family protein [Nitrososphaerales archaeon]
MNPWALIGVPLYTLAGYRGMGDAPEALRKAGLGQELDGTIDMGDVELPSLKKDVTEEKVMNLSNFKDATSRIYNAAKSVQAEKVFVLGGECSVTVGALAGLSEVFSGKPGMLWMDAHGDFNTPETSPSGYIGGMCLAIACGRSPGLGVGTGGRGYSLGEERLVHVGSRALDPPEVAALSASPAKLYTAQHVKKTGVADVAEEAARHLENRSDWIICHLDVDVTDPELIPSVNYPTPGGLTIEETTKIVRRLLETEKMRVLELAAYNAAKDKRGSSGKKIVDLVKAAFT